MKVDLLPYFMDLGFSLNGEQPSPAEVKRRWRELCQKHHPDKGGDTKEFMRVMHAYEMLTNPDYRQKYILSEGRQKNKNGFGDLNIRVQVPVTFETAFFGQRIVVSFNRIELDENLLPITNKPYDIVTEVIDIPAGSVGGFECQISRGGHIQGDAHGEATVVITVMPHARFAVRGGNVITREAVPLDILLKGGSIEVTTMYGIKTLRVPPGTKPGTELQIKGCGLCGRGNHTVQAEALFPTQSDLKSNEAWKGLGIDWSEEKETDLDQADAIIQGIAARLKSQGFIFTHGA